MVASRRLRALLLAGLALLAVAHAVHAFEHWEIVTHAECMAGADDATGHTDGGSHHNHGCTVFDHAPAVTCGHFVLTVTEFVMHCSPRDPGAPALRADEIDHPPRLS